MPTTQPPAVPPSLGYAQKLEREISRYTRLILQRLAIGLVVSAVLLGTLAFMLVAGGAHTPHDPTVKLLESPLSPATLLSAGGVLATVVVAVQFGVRSWRGDPAAPAGGTDELRELARLDLLNIIAWICVLGAELLGLLASFWYSGLPTAIDPIRLVAPLGGGALIAAAAADAMLRTTHPFDPGVARVRTNRTLIRLRSVIVYLPGAPLDRGQWLCWELIAWLVLPAGLTVASEWAVPSPSAVGVVGRMVLMIIACAVSRWVLTEMLVSLLRNQLLTFAAIATLSFLVGFLVWYAAILGALHAPAAMGGRELIAWAFLTVVVPAGAFAPLTRTWSNRRGLLLHDAYRTVVRQTRSMQPDGQSAADASAPRISRAAIAAITLIWFLPAALLFAIRALDEVRRHPTRRGSGLAWTAIIAATTLCLLLLATLLVIG